MEYDKLKKSIDPIITLNDKEWLQVCKSLEKLSLKKNSNFLSEGQVCNSIAFIHSGLLIYFKSLDNGNEITTDFAFEGEWVTDNYSRLNQTPSLMNIKAIEASELYIINNEKLTELYIEIPKLERLGRILIETAFVKIAQLSIDLQSLSAKERYIKMLDRYPAVFQNIPLHHIANYLGIAPKSLSRIRNEIYKKR